EREATSSASLTTWSGGAPTAALLAAASCLLSPSFMPILSDVAACGLVFVAQTFLLSLKVGHGCAGGIERCLADQCPVLAGRVHGFTSARGRSRRRALP